MTYPMSDPHHVSGSGDRTWSQGTRSRVTWLAAPFVFAVVAYMFLSSSGDLGGSPSVFRLFGALAVLSFVSAVIEMLRSAHRVTLRRDGTLELARPIGTVRIRIEQVRAMRVSRFDQHNSQPIRMVTEQGSYRVQRGIDDVHGLVEALRERNPRIELPAI